MKTGNSNRAHLRSAGEAGAPVDAGEALPAAALLARSGSRAEAASEVSQSSTVEGSLDSDTAWLSSDGLLCTVQHASIQEECAIGTVLCISSASGSDHSSPSNQLLASRTELLDATPKISNMIDGSVHGMAVMDRMRFADAKSSYGSKHQQPIKTRSHRPTRWRGDFVTTGPPAGAWLQAQARTQAPWQPLAWALCKRPSPRQCPSPRRAP